MLEGLINRIKGLPKEAILRQAGEALAFWLIDSGLTVEEFQLQLDAGVPVLREALAAIPADDASKVRQMAGTWVRQLTADDYPKVLQALADHPECQRHAQLLAASHYFWTHFVPAMEDAKQWLTTPGAGSSA